VWRRPWPRARWEAVRRETRDVADTTLMMVDFPRGVAIVLAGSTVNERGFEDVIRGTKSNLVMGGNRLQIAPERPYVDEVDARDETPADAGGKPRLTHAQFPGAFGKTSRRIATRTSRFACRQSSRWRSSRIASSGRSASTSVPARLWW
jgi:hypothetical protein